MLPDSAWRRRFRPSPLNAQDMFNPRLTVPLTSYCDPDGLKLYTISAKGQPVRHHLYVERLAHIKRQKTGGWIEDQSKYSFCIWDLELIWHERNSFIRHMYSGTQNIEAYRKDL